MTDPYAAHLNTITFEDYWQELTACGWISETPEDQRTVLKDKLQRAFAHNPLYAFYALAIFSFDAECIYESGPNKLSYYTVIEEIATASNGVFRPVNLQDEFDAQHLKIHISFEHGDRFYRCEVRSDTDWFDEKVIASINEALGDSETFRKFIVLPACDQFMHLVLVSETVYRCAERKKLLPPPDYFFTH